MPGREFTRGHGKRHPGSRERRQHGELIANGKQIGLGTGLAMAVGQVRDGLRPVPYEIGLGQHLGEQRHTIFQCMKQRERCFPVLLQDGGLHEQADRGRIVGHARYTAISSVEEEQAQRLMESAVKPGPEMVEIHLPAEHGGTRSGEARVEFAEAMLAGSENQGVR